MSDDVKQCCARLYESDLVARLLGDSFHPGGAALTERLGERLHLTPDARVLDVAAGRGASALVLARRFGCAVVGVDLGAENLARARADAANSPFAGQLTFLTGDAERLPVDDASVDAVVCECAFCTFPDKSAAAREFARVLKPGGRVGLSDITRAPGPAEEFSDLMSWISCLSGAMSAGEYGRWLIREGFSALDVETHDGALIDMINQIGTRLFAAEVLTGLKQLDLPGVDFPTATRLCRQALDAARASRLGYAIVCATKP